MQFFIDIKNIFYPNFCLSCDSVLTTQEHILCSLCLFNLPLTYYLSNNNDQVKKVFYGRIKIESATALLFYQKKGISQKLIHNLKYKGYEEIGVYLGNWLGEDIVNSIYFKDVDCIIPVPLHKNRLKKRGYNQVSKFGEQLALHLKIPFIRQVLVKKFQSTSQTKKSRIDRWKNVGELFLVENISIIENKHILLIDDIITSGATIEACANELFKAHNIRVSIAVMAITE